MRYIFSRKPPEGLRILLIESGSRHLLEGMLPKVQAWNLGLGIDLLTCYEGRPQGLPPGSDVYYTQDYQSPAQRDALLREFRNRRYAYCGIICSEESILFKWKWFLAVRLPAKVFVVNENGDYFWLSRENFNIVVEFILVRLGLHGTGAVRTLARLAVFPFTLAFLGLYALAVHGKRRLRVRLVRGN